MKQRVLFTKPSILILLAAFLFLISSCDDGNETPPDDPNTGNISGEVNLYDEGTNRQDDSGMKVTIIGSNPEISATTNGEGNFTLSNVPYGTYNLEYSKEGYGTFKLFDVEHKQENNNTVLNQIPSLGQQSSTVVEEVVVGIQGDSIIVAFTLDPPASSTMEKYVQVFFDEQANIDGENFAVFASELPVAIDNPWIYLFSAQQLKGAGFESGTVYVRVMGGSFYTNAYADTDAGRIIFPNVNNDGFASVAFELP